MRTSIIAAVILGLATAVSAATPWRHPGREPFTGSYDEAMRLIPLEAPEIVRQIGEARNRVTVSLRTYTDYVNDYDALTRSQKNELIKKGLFYEKGRLFIENMRAIGTPEALITKIEQEKIDADVLRRTRTTMKRGETCDWMVKTDRTTGRHRTAEQVEWQGSEDITKDPQMHPALKQQNLKAYLAPDGTSLIVYAFTGKTPHHEVTTWEPAVCHDLCLKKYPATLIRRKTQPTPSAPQAPITPIASADTVTLHAYLVKKNDLTAKLARFDGRQSRDLSDEVLKALAESEKLRAEGKRPLVELANECVPVEFLFENVNYNAAHGTPIEIDSGSEIKKGPIESSFSASHNGFRAENTCGGHASISIVRNWVDKSSSVLRVKVDKVRLHYPPRSREVISCAGPGMEPVCGKEWSVPEGWGELYWRLHRASPPPAKNLEFIFVVE